MPAARKAVAASSPVNGGPWLSLLEAAAVLEMSRHGVLGAIAARELDVKQVAVNSRQSRTLVSRTSLEEYKAKRTADAAR